MINSASISRSNRAPNALAIPDCRASRPSRPIEECRGECRARHQCGDADRRRLEREGADERREERRGSLTTLIRRSEARERVMAAQKTDGNQHQHREEKYPAASGTSRARLQHRLSRRRDGDQADQDGRAGAERTVRRGASGHCQRATLMGPQLARDRGRRTGVLDQRAGTRRASDRNAATARAERRGRSCALSAASAAAPEALVFQGRVPATEHQRMRAPFQAGDFPAPVKCGYASVGEVERGPRDLEGRRVFVLYPHQTQILRACISRSRAARLTAAGASRARSQSRNRR